MSEQTEQPADRWCDEWTSKGYRSGSTPRFLQAFEAGTVLGDRYRIERFLARGAMGEVYAAEDLELGGRVALKTVRAEVALDPDAMDRFRREVHLARRVTHPNVCRLFDIEHHRPDGAGAGAEILFLTMELLDGETLLERLRRDGPLTTHEALPLVRQMVDALQAAHDAGVVHRDFKSGNVVLVPGTRGLRAVVTDFGLARANPLGGSETATLTAAGALLGTPAYMAPEQVEGAPVTAAADVYALGVVLYEMVTGRRPFEADSPQSQMLKRLLQPPDSPRRHVPGLDRRWEAVVLRCLERQPKDRFEHVAEVSRALESDEVTLRARRWWPPTHGGRTRVRVAGAALALALAAGAAGAYHAARHGWWTSGAPPAAAPQDAGRLSVAVLGFKNLAGRPDAGWLSTALAEMLGSELASSRRLRILPGESVARMKLELELPEAESYAPDTLARIRANLGADVVVVGSYLVVGGEAGALRFDLRFQDTGSGETLASIVEQGTEPELFGLVSSAGRKLRETLGRDESPDDEQVATRPGVPADTEAARLYAEGLQSLRQLEAQAAAELLQKAIARAPEQPLPHEALAEAWTRLGYDERARLEAQRAFELSAGLSRVERVLLEARAEEAARRWDRALELYRGLAVLYPDNLDYGLRLAATQTAAERSRDALRTLEELRKLPAPEGDDPRIDLAEARAAAALSDQQRVRAAAERAARKGRERGARLLVAEAHLAAWNALYELGATEQAEAACDEARHIYAAARDRGGEARALRCRGWLLWNNRGELAEPRRIYEQVLDVAREIGDRQLEARTIRDIGRLLHEQGDLDAAKAKFEQSLAIFREIGGDWQYESWAMRSLRDVLIAQGRFDEARGQADAALALARERSYRYGQSEALQTLGSLSLQQRDLQVARAAYEQMLQLARDSGDRHSWLGVASTLRQIGHVLLAQGDVEGARARFEESLAVWRESGHRTWVGTGLADLAQAVAQRGDLAGAAERYEEALRVFRELGSERDIAWTLLALAGVRLQQGDPAAQAKHADEALSLFRQAGYRLGEAHALLEQASARRLRGDLAGARRACEDALDIARLSGERATQVRARAALAGTLLDAGDAGGARQHADAALQLARDGQDPSLHAVALRADADVLRREARPEQAVRRAREALELLEPAPGARADALRTRLSLAAALHAAGERAEAQREVERSQADAAAAGLVPEQLDARVELARLMLLRGQPHARTSLQAAERDARQRGFLALADRAAAALRAGR